MNDMKVIIISGGLGTRLYPITEKVPKSMIEVNGAPVLSHQIKFLVRNNFCDIIIATGHLSKMIEDYFGDGKKFGARLIYSKEEKELGTGGALKNAEVLIGKSHFIAIYGDIITNMNLGRMIEFHKGKKGIATLAIHESDHPQDSDEVVIETDGRIISFPGKPKIAKTSNRAVLSNAGIYCFGPDIFSYIPEGKSSLDSDVLPKALRDKEALYGYVTSEMIKDMGTHDRLAHFRKK